MPSYNFEVESYRASTSIQRFASRTRIGRVLELRSYPLYHGIRERAVLSFSTSFDVFTSPVVGHLSHGPSCSQVVGWLPLAEFGFYYELLRSERPIYLFFDTRPGETAGYLTSLRLGTTDEPVGEGPGEGPR